MRKNHNEEKITSGQHFCGKCGSLLSSRGSDCVQCNSNTKERDMKQNHVTRGKGENKSVLPQSSFSFLGRGLLPLVVVGFVLGLVTFSIIGMISAPDPNGCTQCDPFLPGYDGPPPIYIEPDFGYDGGYYDGGYYDGGYGDSFYGPGNNVECIFEECVPYGTGGW